MTCKAIASIVFFFFFFFLGNKSFIATKEVEAQVHKKYT